MEVELSKDKGRFINNSMRFAILTLITIWSTKLTANLLYFRSTYNYYIKEKLRQKWEAARQAGETPSTSELFKQIADEWKNQEDMEKWNELSMQDEVRFEEEIEKFIEQGGQMDNIPYILNENPQKDFSFDFNHFPTLRAQPDMDDEYEVVDAQEDDDLLDGLLPGADDEQDVEDEIREEAALRGIKYEAKEDEESDIEV
jgi:hypothetical protein